ncbi:MAG: hypothetical protein ACI9QL_004145, partial [Candidatus Omnitrophota bacterium]
DFEDLGKTRSDEVDPITRNAWAGPLKTEAAGNPSPITTTTHWIPRGTEVQAQVDGQVLDFSHPGLDIRYVPKAYAAQGSARGSAFDDDYYQNLLIFPFSADQQVPFGPSDAMSPVLDKLPDFSFPQAPPQRQQVTEFRMNGWATITYIWQLQFGIRVNMDDASRSTFPLVIRRNKNTQQEEVLGTIEGTYWIDPGHGVRVASKANEAADPASLALNGWISGDGYYFDANGTVDSDDGSLEPDQPNVMRDGRQVANWENELANYPGYRGLFIPELRRPAKVLWTYGDQVYTNTVRLGEYVFENREDFLSAEPELAALIRTEPTTIKKVSVSGNENPDAPVPDSEMAFWDPNALRLYPLVPGQFRATWSVDDGPSLQVLVTALRPERAHYPHIAGTPPVQLDPDTNDNLIFKSLGYSESQAAITDSSLFTANSAGLSVLRFAEIRQIGRGEPKETTRVRVVDTRRWNEAPPRVLRPTTLVSPPAPAEAVIGQTIVDPGLDLANLGTGYILFENARFNASVYDPAALEGMAAPAIYDMELLRSPTVSSSDNKRVVNPGALPGPVIPINLHPGAGPTNRIVVVWYYAPDLADTILWPHVARTYLPRWPVNESEGLGRIVIASQWGSESLRSDGTDQFVLPELAVEVPNGAGGITTNVFPEARTYDPSRFQQVSVYIQNDRTLPGYNPNEEHALMAPSLRRASITPRPSAAYALRDNDLNRYASALTEAGQPVDYTSHPRVLLQFFDTADQSFKMRVYAIVGTEDLGTDQPHHFGDQALLTKAAPPATELIKEPKVFMKAGEPVIPFYPLGVVIGASPSPETFGNNLLAQETYWEDHRGTSWAVSGGDEAWFTMSTYYPLAPEFWWPENEPGRVVEVSSGNILTGVRLDLLARLVSTGDPVSFMPQDISDLLDLAPGGAVDLDLQEKSEPVRILYKSDWPNVAPVLKAGETLTYSGGEFRTDYPFMDAEDGTRVETPGLPAVLGFAVGEVVFDALNPYGLTTQLTSRWTARMGQVLDVRAVKMPIDEFPPALLPANGLTRVSKGKYIFKDLPASLQKRLRYDPLGQSFDENGLPNRDANGVIINGRLEITGLVNDKSIAEPTLTAPPPAVYILEANILTRDDVLELKALAPNNADWTQSIDRLMEVSRNPTGLTQQSEPYLVGLQPKVERNSITGLPNLTPIEEGSTVMVPETDPQIPESARQFGPGLALIPNGDFLDPSGMIPIPGGSPIPFPEVSWITVAENNDPSQGAAPVTLHVIKVDRMERYRGSIKVVLSDNVFDENVGLRHTGDFGANADKLFFEWWYRADDGKQDVRPPYLVKNSLPSQDGWKFFSDGGLGKPGVTLKANPNIPEVLLADTFWFVRYRHINDVLDGPAWRAKPSPDLFDWAGAGNSNPREDFDKDGYNDYLPQLASGWIKRVLDAVNPYEARIRDFEGDSPSTVSSMLQALGPRFEGAVALNPAKNVIENVGLIELYETVLNRGEALSINLTNPVNTKPIFNALQLASTRISDFYMLLGNEAYTDAADPTIGFGSDSVEYGTMAPVVFSFQNQRSSLLDEQLALMRGVDYNFARPVYNRLFWNFTKGEGEAAYAMNYNITDINADGFIDEADAMILYPQGHGDAWGHYLTAVRKQYNLLKHKNFNWVSRSEFYNLQDIVIPVDFLDERKFAEIAAAKARAGADIVTATYRESYVEDATAQWQGYSDVQTNRAWGVQEWARRAGQGVYFDWVTANALLPSQHPNTEFQGIQKVDRQSNSDIKVVSANLNAIQQTFDDANQGLNPLRLSSDAVPFDINPAQVENVRIGQTHFEQIYDRAVTALKNAVAVWDHANKSQNRLRKVANTEASFRNEVYQEDLSYRNRLIQLFGQPYEGTIGPGKLYPAGFSGPDLALYMYANVREINDKTVPGPTRSFAEFDGNALSGGDIKTAFPEIVDKAANDDFFKNKDKDLRSLFASTFYPDATSGQSVAARDGYYSVNYTDLANPKVDLENLAQLMPVKASGYTFQAPTAWGARGSVGELQIVINRMIQQEASIAGAIAKWDGLTGEIIRTLRLVDAKLETGGEVRKRMEDFTRAKYVIENVLKAVRVGKDTLSQVGTQVNETFESSVESVPIVLPTGGLAVSPGDALSALRGGIGISKVAITSGIGAGEIALRVVELVTAISLDVAEQEVNLANDTADRLNSKREMLKDIEDLVGDEPSLRIAIFKEIEALRALSDRYRSLLNEGGRLVDERAAFNKRVAAMTQQNRYQDMSFRVSRNHALEVYHSTLDLAARYAYLAAKTYDYETSLAVTDPGSPRDLYSEIIRATGPGLVVSGVPQLQEGGLAHSLAWLKTNYDSLKSQLGFNNPQTETGKISLRTELFRILPSGEDQPDIPGSEFENGGQDSDVIWRQKLQDMRVPDLWDIPAYRYFARPFASDIDADGNTVAEPGMVIQFSTKILAGQNFFGKLLSGGDHAYDPSVFATKIRGVGVWFSHYDSTSILDGLPEAPRVYLIPVGTDIMSIANSPRPDVQRAWHVVDQRLPIPMPALSSALDTSNWRPLIDSLNGGAGETRRFSSFRAYHDKGDELLLNELVFDTRLVGRSVWNTDWMLIIPGLTLNSDPDEGLDRFVENVKDIKLIFQTYGYSGN